MSSNKIFSNKEANSTKCLNVKKLSNDNEKCEIPKRVLLGDLQNRELPCIETARNSKDVKLFAIPSIKQSIGSLLKKNTLTDRTETKISTTFNCLKPAVAPIMPASKVTATSKALSLVKQPQEMENEKNTKTNVKVVTFNIYNQQLKIVKAKTNIASKKIAINSYSKIRNIDANDRKSLILVSDYVNDIYEYLFQLELKLPIRKHHLANQEYVTPNMRAILLDWIHALHSQFKMVAETFYITVGIIDRYLQKTNDTQRSNFQLVGVTALFLATKFEELHTPTMAELIYATDNAYNRKQILKMEMQLFKTIDYNLSFPISIHFLRRFAKAEAIDNFQYVLSKYFLELATITYTLAAYRPSEVAAASLFLSLHLTKGVPEIASGFKDSYWNATIQYYSHYTAVHLHSITRKIAFIARQAPDAELSAVYRKYQSSKLYKASMSPVLYSKLMDSLIEEHV